MIQTSDPADLDGPSAGTPAWWDDRYRSGDIPWDTGIVPPEVVDLLASNLVQRGWALDLGCGSGLSSCYLASQGFQVVGLDLALSALVRAENAARRRGLPAFFCLADVSQLGVLNVQARFALDIGCFHAVPPARRSAYIASLADRLLPGAFYLLYAFSGSWDDQAAPRGINSADIGRFAPDFILRWSQYGQDRERPSVWYLLQRS